MNQRKYSYMEDYPSLLWSHTNATFTLQNCLVFPFIASLLAGGNLTDHAINLTQQFSIQRSDNVITRFSGPVIDNYIDSYCATTNASGCFQNNVDFKATNHTYIYPNSSMFLDDSQEALET